ncbi:MAG: O-antigen ligase family protein [Solirubrobacterales bacterium]
MGALCAAVGLLAGIDGRLAIAASLGIAFVLLALVDLTAGLIVFTVGVFLEYAPFVPEGSLSFPKLGGLLLGVSWFAVVTTRRSARPTFIGAHPGATFLFCAFLAWALLSATWAEDSGASLTDVSRYAPNFLIVMIVFTGVAKRSQARWMIGALIAGAAVSAAYGLVIPPEPTEDAFRIESAAGNANVLAAVSIAGLVLALGGALALRGSPLARLSLIGVGGLCLAASLLTGSRSGVIALGAVLIAAILLGGRWRAGAAAVAVLLAVAATAFVAIYAPPEVRERITQTSPGEVSQDEGRVTIWQVGWRMVEDQPLRGIGVGNYASSSINYVLEPGLLTRTDQIIDTPKVAHNIYLHVLAELGIVGLIIFLAILGFCMRCAYRAAARFRARGELQMEVLSRAVLIAMIGVLVSDFFASEQFSKVLWVLLALGPALYRISSTEITEPARPA